MPIDEIHDARRMGNSPLYGLLLQFPVMCFAPPGITLSVGSLADGYREGAFIGEHRSRDRSPPSGYEVVFVPFAGGRPAGPPRDVVTGFLRPDGHARGRPVGVEMDRSGALLVADDLGNAVWRVSQAGITH